MFLAYSSRCKGEKSQFWEVFCRACKNFSKYFQRLLKRLNILKHNETSKQVSSSYV